MALVKYNNNSLSAVTSTAGMPAGAMTLIKSQTASSSSTISFVHGTSDVVLDGTYPIYKFIWINVHPATDDVDFQVGFRDGGSNYNVTATTSAFVSLHYEDDSDASVSYSTGQDQAQGTSFELLTDNIVDSGTTVANDNSASGYLILFNPSSTVFVKHFMSKANHVNGGPYCLLSTHAGYFNTTSAIDEIQFKMSSGNIDAGTFKLYGVS